MPKRFRRSKSSKRDEEAFQDIDLFAMYDDNEKLVEVEFGTPERVIFPPDKSLGCSYQELVDWACAQDESIVVKDDGFPMPLG
jgi:hypothetical protein